MHIAVQQCLKDLKHRQAFTIALLSIIVLQCAIDLLLPVFPGLLNTQMRLGLAFWILLCLIPAMIVQADPLIGDRQFWITRPLTWQNVLAGKFLFFVCSMHIPILLVQSAAMLLSGLNPLHHLSSLAQTQVTAAIAILTCATLASVTRSLKQFLLLVLGILVANLVIGTLIPTPDNLDWGSAEPLRGWILILSLIPAALLLLWLQYSRRATRLTIAFLLFFVLLASAFPSSTIFWHPLARLHARMDGVLLRQPPVKVELSRDRSPLDTSGWANMSGDAAALVLPVRLSGIPNGYRLINERTNFQVVGSDGSAWSTGWLDSGGIYTDSLKPHSRIIPADGVYSTATTMDWNIYRGIQNDPVRARISFVFLLGSPVRIPLAEDRLMPADHETGFCGKADGGILCVFNKRPSLILEYPSHDTSFIRLEHSDLGSIWRYRFYSSALPGQKALEVHRKEAWFEATLEIPQIYLKDYLCNLSQ